MYTTKRTALALATLLLAACGDSTGKNSEVASTLEQDAAEIWAKEVAIFEGRGVGDISNYLDVASDDYLGWPPVLPTPTSLDTLRATADKAVALNGEISNLSRKGFTRNGNTALMYFLNHRTRLGDGMAPEGEREVDQFYENVHIWNKEDGQWMLIGGFARTVDAPRN